MTVYFDNAATTPVCPEAISAAAHAMTENFGNPSSTHAPGRAARLLLENARESVAAALSASASEVYFTSGGTESCNWAVLRGFDLMRHDGGHIISTAIEHDAVSEPLKRLAASGADVTLLKPDPETGAVSLSDFCAALRDDTVFASVMLVNNETGAINPVAELSSALNAHNPAALFHTDAVQAFCKTPFSVKALGVDMVSVSGHKIHAPKGAGALWVKKGVRIKPLLLGGGQEKKLRSGTEAIPAIAAFGAAAKAGLSSISEAASHIRSLRDFTLTRIMSELPEAALLCDGEPGILSVSLPGYKSEVLLNFLDAEGVFISKSSACKKGARSHVLKAMGFSPEIIDSAIRISFSRYNTKKEAELFAQKLRLALQSITRLK